MRRLQIAFTNPLRRFGCITSCITQTSGRMYLYSDVDSMYPCVFFFFFRVLQLLR
jgi:hypothetical protein